MPKNLHARSAETLTENISDRVNLYSVAALAAGVSMLALARPAAAAVIITKKNIPIPVRVPVSIDLNKDGVSDFRFSLKTYVASSYNGAALTVQAATRKFEASAGITAVCISSRRIDILAS